MKYDYCDSTLSWAMGIPKSDSALSWTVLSLIQRCPGQQSDCFSAVLDSSQIASALSWTALSHIHFIPK